MAFLSLTKKAAVLLKINTTQAVSHEFTLPVLEDWIIDTIWPEKKKNPGILFYNRATGFVMALNPAEYQLGYCLEIVKQQMERLLNEHSMEEKMPYFNDLFSIIHICKNNDRSAVGYMTQSKLLIDSWLDRDSAQRVDNSYDLMKRINDVYHKVDGNYLHTRMQDFMIDVEKITGKSGMTVLQAHIPPPILLH
jgi:hypothetical protein